MSERSTIEAVVGGVQRRALQRRKRTRQGWAFLLSGALSIPIISASFDGTITLVTAATRIGVALFITTGIVAMVGSLFDSYQGQAAVATVQDAVIEARARADEDVDTVGASTGARASDDGGDDER